MHSDSCSLAVASCFCQGRRSLPPPLTAVVLHICMQGGMCWAATRMHASVWTMQSLGSPGQMLATMTTLLNTLLCEYPLYTHVLLHSVVHWWRVCCDGEYFAVCLEFPNSL